MAGFSLIETLVALALTASVSAALLPALAVAARLHRDSALETGAAMAAGARLARLAIDASSGMVEAGGSLSQRQSGWHEFIDASGAPADVTQAAFEVRWQIAVIDAPAGASVVSVRVISLASPGNGVVLTTVVPDG